MRDGIESFAAVGREGHVVEETGGPGSGDGIGTEPSVGREDAERDPKTIADDLAKMAESYAMQAIYGSKQGRDGQQVPDTEDKTTRYSRCCAARRPQTEDLTRKATRRGSSCR
ncbi:hypothetical protein ERJ75_000902900 [Trypanosoma vivax]|nr:hypothetical protein ERJ75_000902900 [Trypanosoma vivax]